MANNGEEAAKQGGNGLPPLPARPIFNLQSAALVVFVGLALAICVVSVVSVVLWRDSVSPTIPRTLAVLLIAAVACVVIAWLDQANTLMFGQGLKLLGRGLRHVLTIQRAAVASFVGSGIATICVATFVAFSALFTGGVEKGLFALASIEFLLKLAAVSAIVALMTLRKPATRRAPATEKPTGANGDTDTDATPPPEDEEDDRGRLEFGSLAFAFSLVVVGALIVPSEDLMRIASMFFGGDKKIEDYLPSRPVVTVEDDIGEKITNAVADTLDRVDFWQQLDQDSKTDMLFEVRTNVERVVGKSTFDGVRRTGAWPLLEGICLDEEDAIIFTNSDDKILAEHLSYLAAEGLIEYPYGNINSIEITENGTKIVFDNTGTRCVDAFADSQGADIPRDEVIPPLPPRVENLAGTTASEVINDAPYTRELRLTGRGAVFQLNIAEGQYVSRLFAIDSVDPVLQLFDSSGALIAENDDSGPVTLNSALDFAVKGDRLLLRVSSFDGREGLVRLQITPAALDVGDPSENSAAPSANIGGPASANEVDQAETDAAALRLLDESESKPLPELAEIPADGAVFSFTALTSGEHVIHTFHLADQSTNVDLVAVLFHLDNGRRVQIGYDDDTGLNGFPVVTAALIQGQQYLLLLRHYAEGVAPASVGINVYPPVSTMDALDPTPIDAGEPAGEVTEPEAPTESDTSAEPATAPLAQSVEPEGSSETMLPTGSDGSQSDP